MPTASLRGIRPARLTSLSRNNKVNAQSSAIPRDLVSIGVDVGPGTFGKRDGTGPANLGVCSGSRCRQRSRTFKKEAARQRPLRQARSRRSHGTSSRSDQLNHSHICQAGKPSYARRPNDFDCPRFCSPIHFPPCWSAVSASRIFFRGNVYVATYAPGRSDHHYGRARLRSLGLAAPRRRAMRGWSCYPVCYPDSFWGQFSGAVNTI